MAETYNAAQIVGKTLIARRIVDIWNRTPDTSGAKKIGGVKSGQPVGVVVSWVQNNNDKSLWWQFRNTDGTFYYAPHESGLYDVDALKQQGALSNLEQIEAEKQKEADDRPWYEKLGEGIGKTLTRAAIGVGCFILIREMIRSSNNK